MRNTWDISLRPGNEYMDRAKQIVIELGPTLMAELHTIRYGAYPNFANIGIFQHYQVIDRAFQITEFGRQCCSEDNAR